MFLLLPVAALGIGLGSEIALYGELALKFRFNSFLVVSSILVFTILSISIINTLQKKKPKTLPVRLRNWKWLPLAMRSLKPYDDLFCSKCTCCLPATTQANEETEQPNGHTNESYEPADEQSMGISDL